MFRKWFENEFTTIFSIFWNSSRRYTRRAVDKYIFISMIYLTQTGRNNFISSQSNITNTCYYKQLQMIPLLISNSFYELHWDEFSGTCQNRWHDITRNNSFCNGYISVIFCKYVDISRSYCSFCKGSLRNQNAHWNGLPNKMKEKQSYRHRMYRQLFGVLSKREESREIPYAHYFMWTM